MTLQEHSETGMEFYQYCHQEFDAELSKFKAKLGNKKSSLKYHSKYITVDEFLDDKDKHKAEIISLIQSNNYKFDSLTPIFLPKDKNNYRMVCVPSVKDRLIQLLFMSYLDAMNKKQEFQTNDFAYGEIYADLKGVKAAHDKLKYLRRKYKYALKTDIESFFDQLDRHRISALFETKIGLPNLQLFFKEMIRADPHVNLLQEASEERTELFIEILKRKRGRGIRQGMPIASLLASFYLQDFEKVLQSKGVEFIRYADDLVIFANSRKVVTEHFELIRSELLKIQLSIPDIGVGKTEIYTASQTLVFLGLELKKVDQEYKLFIPQKAFFELSQKMIKLQGYKKNTKGGLNFYKTCQKIDQICNGYIVCYEFAANLTYFKKHIAERKLFVYQRLLAPLGIDYAKLSAEKKKYFFNE
jgi:RNA-directed DNA polymerase